MSKTKHYNYADQMPIGEIRESLYPLWRFKELYQAQVKKTYGILKRFLYRNVNLVIPKEFQIKVLHPRTKRKVSLSKWITKLAGKDLADLETDFMDFLQALLEVSWYGFDKHFPEMTDFDSGFKEEALSAIELKNMLYAIEKSLTIINQVESVTYASESR